MDNPDSRIIAGLVLPSYSSANHPNSCVNPPSIFMTNTTSQNASNLQVDQIDQEILRHEETVRDLKFRRNLLAPISKFPAEILCAIFMFCNLADSPTHPSYPADTRWRWVSVTHVSRLWRNTALSCPALWSKPEFTRTEWAYEMIRRSKMAPLAIEVTSDMWLTPRVLDAVSEGLKHLPRINEIRLSASRDNMVKLLTGINHAAPFLRTLLLDVGRSDYYYPSLSEPYMLPEDFLGGDTSHLSHIELTRCHLPWDSSLLRNITFLKVHNPGPPAPTLDQFIGALIGMPQLEVLDLENSLPATSDTESTEKLGVSLPRLRRLRTVGTINECAIFLEHVVVPSNATIHLAAKCSDPPEVGSSTLQLIRDVCQRLPVVRETASTSSSSNSPSIKSLLVQSTGGGSGVILEAWNSVPKIRSSFTTLYPSRENSINPVSYVPSIGWLKLELSWRNSVTRRLHDEVIVAVCRPLPLTQLRNLHIRNGYPDSVSSPTFANTFGMLPKVNTLTVEGDSAYEFVEALSQHTGSQSGPGVDGVTVPSTSGPSPGRLTLAFPALRTLKLIEADFDRENEMANTLLPPLLDCLMQRYEYKAEVHKLILERCTRLNSDDVQELEEIVADVDWDQIESGYSESEDEEMDDYDEDGMDIYGGEAYFGYGPSYLSSDEDMMYLGF
ncbi:hypothetical protein DFJ43DRAFT_1094890 [Lentinula guzmanii]|uniref:F-box domain-containing protein n=1 Tax=Lentinula guzmanii TaxID=2804957 RepID=A0AA38MWP6_9AGAR|nr:hypothetical protein DFJ43DRAFT_1094890 [Lentinula guzmanii]